MQIIKEFILSALNEGLNELPPQIDQIAYDCNNDRWVVIDFCLVKDTKKVKKLMKEYDRFYEYRDNYETDFYSPDSFAVAAYKYGDSNEVGLFDWHPSDLWYEKR